MCIFYDRRERTQEEEENQGDQEGHHQASADSPPHQAQAEDASRRFPDVSAVQRSPPRHHPRHHSRRQALDRDEAQTPSSEGNLLRKRPPPAPLRRPPPPRSRPRRRSPPRLEPLGQKRLRAVVDAASEFLPSRAGRLLL